MDEIKNNQLTATVRSVDPVALEEHRRKIREREEKVEAAAKALRDVLAANEVIVLASCGSEFVATRVDDSGITMGREPHVSAILQSILGIAFEMAHRWHMDASAREATGRMEPDTPPVIESDSIIAKPNSKHQEDR